MSAGGAGEAPLFAGRIHGVRGWSVVNGRLHGAIHTGPWRAGAEPTEARCAQSRLHDAPHEDCGCGLYAYHPFNGRSNYGEVTGVVEAWGRVEVHRDGFRAQHARPIALFVSPGASAGERQHLKRIARAHLCEVIEADDPAQVCAKRGWGLAPDVVAELLPRLSPGLADDLHLVPVHPRKRSRLERLRKSRLNLIWQVPAIAVLAVFTAAWYAVWIGFYALLAYGGFVLVTGFNPLGLEFEPDSPELTRAADVRVAREWITRGSGDDPPIYVARLENRGEEAAVWARPTLELRRDGELLGRVRRREFAYPAVVPAGGAALVAHPLHGHEARGLRVRAGPVAARDVERPPLAPARARLEVRRRGGDCLVVARVRSRQALPRLVLRALAISDGRARIVWSQRIRDVGRGRSVRVAERVRDCPDVPRVVSLPAFGPGQLVHR